MKDNLFIVAAVILAGAMISGAIIYSSQNKAGDLAAVVPGLNNSAEEKYGSSIAVDVTEDDDAFKGDSNAPVAIIEFSDFECPFCAVFYRNTLPLIEEKYIKTGKVKLVYRDYPFPFHPSAQKAAEAAECAGEQGKFWEMHNAIFENQKAIDVNNLEQYAVNIGFNSDSFNNCLDSGKYFEEVKKDFSDGENAGVAGTPTFFINGEKLVGAQPFDIFEEVIQRKLQE